MRHTIDEIVSALGKLQAGLDAGDIDQHYVFDWLVVAETINDLLAERRQPEALPNDVLSRQVVNASSFVDTDGADDAEQGGV